MTQPKRFRAVTPTSFIASPRTNTACMTTTARVAPASSETARRSRCRQARAGYGCGRATSCWLVARGYRWQSTRCLVFRVSGELAFGTLDERAGPLLFLWFLLCRLLRLGVVYAGGRPAVVGVP